MQNIHMPVNGILWSQSLLVSGVELKLVLRTILKSNCSTAHILPSSLCKKTNRQHLTETFAIFYACFCFVPHSSWRIAGSFHRQNQAQWQLVAHFGPRAGDENTAFPYQLESYSSSCIAPRSPIGACSISPSAVLLLSINLLFSARQFSF